MTYATVAPAARLSPLRDELTYAVTPAQLPTLTLGQLVWVRVRGRLVSGVVTGFTRQRPAAVATLNPIELITPIQIPATVVALARWLRSWYWQPLGQCFRTLLPPPRKRWSVQGNETRSPLLAEPSVGQAATFVITGGFDDRIRRYDQLVGRSRQASRSTLLIFPHAQALRRFIARSQHPVTAWRSTGSGSTRWQQWQDCQSRSKVVAGLRSAVFAPVTNLGLLIVDSPESRGLKEDQAPAYRVARVAKARQTIERCHLIWGGVLPPLSQLMSPRLTPLPPQRPMQLLPADPARPTLLQSDAETWLTNGAAKQTFVLLNQIGRGFRRCRDCGQIVRCPTCDGLPIETDQRLQCGTCGWHGQVPRRCQQCGSLTLGLRGNGTEAMAASLARKLGEPVGILDRNHPQRPSHRVTVGTSYALPFFVSQPPDRALVLGLELLRQRATYDGQERAIRLIAELSTFVEELAIEVTDQADPWFRAVAAGHWATLLDAELAERRRAAYPPTVTLALCRSAHPPALTAIRAALAPTVRSFGPAPRRDGRGFQLLVKLPRTTVPARWLERLTRGGFLRTVTVELDPSTDALD